MDSVKMPELGISGGPCEASHEEICNSAIRLYNDLSIQVGH